MALNAVAVAVASMTLQWQFAVLNIQHKQSNLGVFNMTMSSWLFSSNCRRSFLYPSQIPFGPYRRFQLESPHRYYMILGTCLLSYLLQFSRGDMKPWTVLKTPPQHYYAHSFLVKLCMLTTLKYYSVHSIVECCTNDIITRISIQTAGLAFGGTGLCSYRVRGVGGSRAKHLTVESYTVVMLLTLVLVIISIPSPPLLHSRLKTLLFCKSFPP